MRHYAGYIFDLDGTVYLDEQLLPGALQVLPTLRSSGSRLVFVSNNPTFTRRQMMEKLNRLGVEAGLHEVVNSSYVLVQYLLQQSPGAILYPVGEASLENELIEAGFEISDDPGRIDIVIASFDRTFVYRKLQVSFDAIRAGARLIATNADRYCPTLHGGEPDAACMIAAIEACTGVHVEVVVGKPSMFMAHTALSVLKTEPCQTLMVGDRLETDIQMGARAEMDTALILTGATRAQQLSLGVVQPTYVLNSLMDFLSHSD
jgi:HAD superfamily hydrolase (TIGR01450 family)